MPMKNLVESRRMANSRQGKRWAQAGMAGAAALCALAGGSVPAQAQRYETGPTTVPLSSPTIEDRFSDMSETSRIRMGGFLMRAFLGQDIGYNDNVFASQNKRGDFTYVSGGGGTIQSDWKQHQAYATVNAAYVGYARFSEENDWVGNAATGGYVDINRDIRAGFDVSAARLIDQRGDPDSINAANGAVTYQRYRAEPWITAETGRFNHTLAAQGETTNYPNATRNNGSTINLAAKEYEQVRVGYRLGYRFLDPYEAFVQVSSWDRNSTNDAGIPNENFTVKTLAGGIAARITPVIGFTAAGGIQHVTNDNPVIPSADVPTYDLRLIWEPMQTLRLEARATREFASSVVTAFVQGSPGYVRNIYALRATSEIRQGLVGFADGFYLVRDYIDSPQIDHVWAFDVGFRYALGNNLVAGATWLWRNETTNGNFVYNNNIVLARISKSF